MLKLQTSMTTIVRNHLANESLLLGKINYSILPNKIVIRIPFYSNSAHSQTSTNKLNSLASALQSYLSLNYPLQNQKISHYSAEPNSRIMFSGCVQETWTAEKGADTLELRFIPLQYPYLDSYILNQFIAINASKYNFNRIQKLLFNKISSAFDLRSKLDSKVNVSDAYNVGFDLLSEQNTQKANTLVSGLKLELSGRLTTQRSIPRKTVSNAHIGKFKGDSTLIKDTTQLMSSAHYPQSYASKNKIGAFTIKVWLGNT